MTMFLYMIYVYFENLYRILDRYLALEELSHVDFQYIVFKHISMSGCNVKQLQFYTVVSDHNMYFSFCGT